jgi:hypothetical protein
MREFTKSLFSYSLAVSLFSVKQVQSLFTAGEVSTGPLDDLTDATAGRLGERLGSVFRTLDGLQREFVGFTFGLFMPFSSSAPAKNERELVPSSSEPMRWVEVMPDPVAPVDGDCVTAAEPSPTARPQTSLQPDRAHLPDTYIYPAAS